MAGTVSSILFSATFLPIQYYKGLLGGTADDFEMYARSSFLPEQQKVVIVRDVTSRYRDRGEKTYDRIARGIHGIILSRPGNYMVFFPSYAFLEAVRDAFVRTGIPCLLQEPGDPGAQDNVQDDIQDDMQDAVQEGLWTPDGSFKPAAPPEDPAVERNSGNAGGAVIRILSQSRQMDEKKRAAFLQAFEESRPDRYLAGFCVMGGMFGEGIDLRQDRLIGSLIVGTGIPPVEPRRELLRSFFERQGKNGYDFAYRFPGMNKVLQAAGRVIRTAQDTGIVVLMDSRFGETANRGLFPAEWGRPEEVGSLQAPVLVRSFWESRSGSAELSDEKSCFLKTE